MKKYYSHHTTYILLVIYNFLTRPHGEINNTSGYRSSMNNMEEVIKFTENHQKQEITVVEASHEMSSQLFKFLHKSDVRMISVVEGMFVFLSIHVVDAASLSASENMFSAGVCVSAHLSMHISLCICTFESVDTCF